jgi:hypothetical protein
MTIYSTDNSSIFKTKTGNKITLVYIEEGKNSKTYIPLKKYTRKKLEEKG